MTKEKKVNIPKKGAARKWLQRLKELTEQEPHEDLLKKINEKEDDKKVARPQEKPKDLDL